MTITVTLSWPPCSSASATSWSAALPASFGMSSAVMIDSSGTYELNHPSTARAPPSPLWRLLPLPTQVQIKRRHRPRRPGRGRRRGPRPRPPAYVDPAARRQRRHSRPGKPALKRPVTLLFTDRGLPIHSQHWSRLWKRWRAAAGWPEQATFHAPRHYFATTLITAGADPTDVQRALRHASLRITLETYVHWWPKKNRRPQRHRHRTHERREEPNHGLSLIRSVPDLGLMILTQRFRWSDALLVELRGFEPHTSTAGRDHLQSDGSAG
jgi:hypothetical protein